MRVGITGHRHRPGIDWRWVAEAFGAELQRLGPVCGVTSLAIGADQIFADLVLKLGGEIEFVRPCADYRDDFHDAEGLVFDHFLSAARSVVIIKPMPDRPSSYLAAGRYIALNSDLLFALWDGQPALGKGGTAEIVAYAQRIGTLVLRFDPFKRSRAWGFG